VADTLARLADVFRDVFEDDDLQIDRGTTAAQVQGWDSVMHITLMMGVERAFGIRFRSGEVAGLRNVGELADLVDARKGA
jgi:acyl carrier protein